MNNKNIDEEKIRPKELISEMGISKDTYYEDLGFLGIKEDAKKQRDSEGKYLTQEQANLLRLLRSHVANKGKREGFAANELVVADNSNIAESVVQEIPSPEEENGGTDSNLNEQLDLSLLMRGAAELKTEKLIVLDLLKQEIANKMTEEDLPQDLREKVALVREASHPKAQPAQVASLAESLLSQWRNSQGGN